MKITRNFYREEFDSRDGSVMPFKIQENIVDLAQNLQVVRDYINTPLTINSGYRSPQHNENIGGVSNSYHVLGMAADITVKNYSPKRLARLLKRLIKKGLISKGGVGLYNGFVHYDIRGYNARWDNSSWYNF